LTAAFSQITWTSVLVEDSW